jgi:membrane protein DedA with SNARE-associated domain
MHIYADILSFISDYGYLGVFLGAVLEGETLIMMSGFLVHEKYLLFRYVLLFGFLGAVIGDLSWFLLGKYKGNTLLSKWPWLKRVSQKPVGYINKKPALVSFWVRFIYGFRHIIPFTLGMSGYPTRLFIFHYLRIFTWKHLRGIPRTPQAVSACDRAFGYYYHCYL